jgi:hypothetical protein
MLLNGNVARAVFWIRIGYEDEFDLKIKQTCEKRQYLELYITGYHRVPKKKNLNKPHNKLSL